MTEDSRSESVRVVVRFRPPFGTKADSVILKRDGHVIKSTKLLERKDGVTMGSPLKSGLRKLSLWGIKDEDEGTKPIVDLSSDGKSVEIACDRSSAMVISSPRASSRGTRKPHNFAFDHVFGPESTNVSTFEAIGRDTVKDVLAGYNGTLFAYGQTGSGKTFTMFGPGGPNHRQKGIVPRCAHNLFEGIDALLEDDSVEEITIQCSFLEIYKEEIQDLLCTDNHHLRLRENVAGEIYVQGLTTEYVSGVDELLALITEGEKGRTVSSTNMNEVSSRSHSVFIIKVTQKLSDGTIRVGKLNLADLAGSERVNATGASGQTLEEAKKINQSLSALGNCIKALTETKRSHIPFRDSTLTLLLRDSLGGNCKTTLLVCCATEDRNIQETLSTLRFAKRAKKVKNKVCVNKHLSKEQLTVLAAQLRKKVRIVSRLAERYRQALVQVHEGKTVDIVKVLGNALNQDGSGGGDRRAVQNRMASGGLGYARTPKGRAGGRRRGGIFGFSGGGDADGENSDASGVTMTSKAPDNEEQLVLYQSRLLAVEQQNAELQDMYADERARFQRHEAQNKVQIEILKTNRMADLSMQAAKPVPINTEPALSVEDFGTWAPDSGLSELEFLRGQNQRVMGEYQKVASRNNELLERHAVLSANEARAQLDLRELRSGWRTYLTLVGRGSPTDIPAEVMEPESLRGSPTKDRRATLHARRLSKIRKPVGMRRESRGASRGSIARIHHHPVSPESPYKSPALSPNAGNAFKKATIVGSGGRRVSLDSLQELKSPDQGQSQKISYFGHHQSKGGLAGASESKPGMKRAQSLSVADAVDASPQSECVSFSDILDEQKHGPVVKKGYLYHRPFGFSTKRSWQLKLFVLRTAKLDLYEPFNTGPPVKSPPASRRPSLSQTSRYVSCGCIVLSDAMSLSGGLGAGRHKHVLELWVDGHKFKLAAQSSSDLSEWVAALKSVWEALTETKRKEEEALRVKASEIRRAEQERKAAAAAAAAAKKLEPQKQRSALRSALVSAEKPKVDVSDSRRSSVAEKSTEASPFSNDAALSAFVAPLDVGLRSKPERGSLLRIRKGPAGSPAGAIASLADKASEVAPGATTEAGAGAGATSGTELPSSTSAVSGGEPGSAGVKDALPGATPQGADGVGDGSFDSDHGTSGLDDVSDSSRQARDSLKSALLSSEYLAGTQMSDTATESETPGAAPLPGQSNSTENPHVNPLDSPLGGPSDEINLLDEPLDLDDPPMPGRSSLGKRHGDKKKVQGAEVANTGANDESNVLDALDWSDSEEEAGSNLKQDLFSDTTPASAGKRPGVARSSNPNASSRTAHQPTVRLPKFSSGSGGRPSSSAARRGTRRRAPSAGTRARSSTQTQPQTQSKPPYGSRRRTRTTTTRPSTASSAGNGRTAVRTRRSNTSSGPAGSRRTTTRRPRARTTARR